MFWQIKISEKDQMYHGVIYNGETYMSTRICFGNKASPPIADMCIVKIAHLGKETCALASQVLLFKRYMDSILNSNSDEKLLVQTRKEVDELIGKFGFEIKEWFINNPRIGSTSKEKNILGIRYDVEKDKLYVAVNLRGEIKFMKRKVLLRIAEIMVPMGICAGVMLIEKLIFQPITRLNFGWDQIIDNGEWAWEKWNQEIEKCTNVLLPRSILPSEKYLTEKWSCDKIGFSDGSNNGYGCVIYL